MNEILFLKSPLREQIWGSKYFQDKAHLTKDDKLYGEYWTLSGYENFSSIITNGEFKDWELNKLFKEHKELFNNSKLDKFPILIKLIATSSPLSVQVHPDDEYAKRENDLGKVESWLIIDSNNSEIVYGHNAKDKNEFIKKVKNNEFKDLLSYHNVKRGMFIPVEAGTIHALGKDLVLLEVQQSSNVTYRLYDYDRLDKNGNKRELHLDKAIDVVKVPDSKSIKDIDYLDSKEDIELWNNEYFNIKLCNVIDELDLVNDNDYLMVTVCDGEINVLDKKIGFGESFIITSKCKEISLKGNGKILLVKSNK